jgi:hypothetical protein
MSIAVDNRQVVLLKSLRTNNRFYTLVEPNSGYKNADAIEEFPPHLPLGIAYPCLEDGLNDFAVIRTTFETIDVFPDDEDLRTEMMDIIKDARGNLVRRLEELRDRITAGQAHFLGTDLQEFKDHILHMINRGSIRRTLDNMMKVDVFESVSKAEAALRGGAPDPMYRYQLLSQHALSIVEPLPPRAFIGRLFDDVLDAVTDDENYQNKYTFDSLVFQKFIAVMFVNYATTDPMFYGTNPKDYGVSGDRDMQETPLYRAVATALRELERGVEFGMGTSASPPPALDDLSGVFDLPQSEEDFLEALREAAHTVEIPFGAAERLLLQPLALLADAVRLLKTVDHARAPEIRAMAANAGQQIFRNLQELQIVSPLANDPVADALNE